MWRGHVGPRTHMASPHIASPRTHMASPQVARASMQQPEDTGYAHGEEFQTPSWATASGPPEYPAASGGVESPYAEPAYDGHQQANNDQYETEVAGANQGDYEAGDPQIHGHTREQLEDMFERWTTNIEWTRPEPGP